jgi:ligand-binding sensor domain-containing protein
MVLPGPVSNDIFHINSGNGKTLISGGGINTWWTNLNRPLEVSVFDNNTWKSITSTTINDAMRSITNPVNRDHMFVATWGGGLLEYKNNILVNQYSYQNSPLQTIIPGQPYVRICGMAFDKDGLLWITQTQVPGSVKVLKPDGQWIVNPLTIETPTVGDLIITSTGKKWIVLPRGPGLYVLDDKGTPEIFTDDRKKMLIVKDTENKTITTVLSIAEDLDGNIWVGTDQGPLIYYNPDKVFDEDLKAFRIKAPRNDGSQLSDIVLVTETITTISVDGANRKWLGTNNSGAYLLSPDGLNLIKHFNEQNSPILSNTINSLAIDNKTGDVWFGTTAGVVSYRGNATTGEEKFSKVYTFPNPVREDFTGNVTITGLLRDTQIRITDISGNLVYQTESDGGEATWNLSNYNGKRVSTGVYLVFCASKDGTQSTVTKMLVIR